MSAAAIAGSVTPVGSTQALVLFRFGASQAPLTVRLLIFGPPSAVTEASVELHLPTKLAGPRHGYEVQAACKVRADLLFDRPGQQGEVTLLVSGGGSIHDFQVALTTPVEQASAVGQLGQALTVAFPLGIEPWL
ncbi:MAG: hypothetical protein KGL39_39180 [Patescibacteria group bacterium]|nr:hypothetical protein [Patescibacteria group bacterium]